MAQTKKQEADSKKPDGPIMNFHSFSEINSPDITEDTNGRWVNYGEENLYPQLLIDKYRKSAVHNALVNGISQFIAGDGLIGFGDLNKYNSLGDNPNDTNEKVAKDLKLHGYFCLQVIYSILGDKIIEVIHTPAEKVRSGVADHLGIVNNYWISNNWEEISGKNAPKSIPAFNPKKAENQKRQLMFVKIQQPGQFYYSVPDYIGALNYISLDDEISEFHLNNIQNGFFPSALVQFFNGKPSQQAQTVLESKFKKKFGGGRGSKIGFVYNDNKNQSVQFDTFEPADLDERFKNLGPQVTQKIMIAHRVTTPMLFGVKTDVGLGNNAEEMATGLIIFNNLVIKPYQNVILRAYKRIAEFNNHSGEIIIQSLQPDSFLKGVEADTSSATEPQVQMSEDDTREIIPEDLVNPMMGRLDEVGEQKDKYTKQGYELVNVPDDIPDDQVEAYLKSKYNFAITSNPDEKSKLDTGLFKIRYKYEGPKDDANRTFCHNVLTKDLIYRKEDIDQMSFRSENSQFGTYSIFRYKGSYGCRHKWDRLVFFRKRNTNGQFLPNDGLENEKQVSKSNPEYRRPNDVMATNVNPDPK